MAAELGVTFRPHTCRGTPALIQLRARRQTNTPSLADWMEGRPAPRRHTGGCSSSSCSRKTGVQNTRGQDGTKADVCVHVPRLPQLMWVARWDTGVLRPGYLTPQRRRHSCTWLL